MGLLSSAIGKPAKWLGGAAALYGGYKLASDNRDELRGSFDGVMEGLEQGDKYEAILGLLDSTSEQMGSSPDYGSNLSKAGTGLGIAAVGAYLDGSLRVGDVMPERYLEDVELDDDTPDQGGDEGEPDRRPFNMDYTQVGGFEDPDNGRYMMLREASDDEGSLYAVPVGDLDGYRVDPDDEDNIF